MIHRKASTMSAALSCYRLGLILIPSGNDAFPVRKLIPVMPFYGFDGVSKAVLITVVMKAVIHSVSMLHEAFAFLLARAGTEDPPVVACVLRLYADIQRCLFEYREIPCIDSA